MWYPVEGVEVVDGLAFLERELVGLGVDGIGEGLVKDRLLGFL